MTTLFVSDLHLCAEHPAITESFLSFLAGPARQAEGLYILGDLFDRWIGDDAIQSADRIVLSALRTLVQSGVPLWIMPGNHDFLYGARFLAETGSQLLPDPYVFDRYGTPTLLMHGDLLCTQDVSYQTFRKMVRDPDWQAAQLAKPVAVRAEIARELLSLSRTHTTHKCDAIMQADQATIESFMRTHRVHRLIHGHTHRPACHHFLLDGHAAQRIVLPNWNTEYSANGEEPKGTCGEGGYLRVSANRHELLPCAVG